MDAKDVILFMSVFQLIWHMLPKQFTKYYGSKQSFHDDQQTLSQHLSNHTYVIPTRSRLFTKFLCLLPANFSYHVPRYPGVFHSRTRETTDTGIGLGKLHRFPGTRVIVSLTFSCILEAWGVSVLALVLW